MLSIGLEFSTQSVKMVGLDLDHGDKLYADTFDYDVVFPQYGTKGGVLPSDAAEIRHTSPGMLTEALDFAFDMMRQSKIALDQVAVIKADGMQHCTLYLDRGFRQTLQDLNPDQRLIDQLAPRFSRAGSPIWEDRSPVAESEVLTAMLSDKGGIRNLTGNRAELRFPAAQILKWAKENPEEYHRTNHILLLSAYITSLLIGEIAPVDTGDGWGTNLNQLDINHPNWEPKLTTLMDETLQQIGIADSLTSKLGSMTHYDAPAGTISPYWVQKFGVNPSALVLTGTGDNPATLLGCGGQMVISLGSSYTVNGVLESIVPSRTDEFNIFGYTRSKAMALSVITNGTKLHDHFLQRYLGLAENEKPVSADWQKYEQMVGTRKLSPNENLMLPYLLDESVPRRPMGIVRDGFSAADAEKNIRALHVSQILSLKMHAGHLGTVDKLCVVGGGAKNKVLMQWLADAFNAETYSITHADVAAPFGCAISGAATMLKKSYSVTTEQWVQKDETTICSPNLDNHTIISQLLERYKQLEK